MRGGEHAVQHRRRGQQAGRVRQLLHERCAPRRPIRRAPAFPFSASADALSVAHPTKPCTAPAATPDIPSGALPNGNGGLCYSSLTACLNGRVLLPQARRPRPILLPRRVRARLLLRRRWARSPNICSAAEPCVDQPSLCNTGTSGGTNNSWCARASRCPRRFVSAAEPLLSSISARACFLQDLHAVDARTRASNGCALPLRQVRPLCTRSCFTACVARSRVPPPAWQGRATSAT